MNGPPPRKIAGDRSRATAVTLGLTAAGGGLTAVGLAAVLTAGVVLLPTAVLLVLLGGVVTAVSFTPRFAHGDAGPQRAAGFAAGLLVGLVTLMVAWG